MGSEQGKFKEEHMKEFEATTPFNRAEIYHAFKVFQQMYDSYSRKADERLMPLFVSEEQYINPEATLPVTHICDELPALRANPFRERMCELFTVSGNNSMSFVEFIDMASAFSPKNPTSQKIFHAFQIFDDNRDGIISREDLRKMLDKITDKEMPKHQKDIIISSVFEEVNKECHCDGLSTEDFRYAISKAPDFASTFSFQL